MSLTATDGFTAPKRFEVVRIGAGGRLAVTLEARLAASSAHNRMSLQSA